MGISMGLFGKSGGGSKPPSFLQAILKGASQGAKGAVKQQIRSSPNRVVQAAVKGWDAGKNANNPKKK